MGAILLEFLLLFFFQDCELAFTRQMDILSQFYLQIQRFSQFFFLGLFSSLTNQVLHHTIYIMFTNQVLHLIRAIFHLQTFIKELLYVLNTLDQGDARCKILYRYCGFYFVVKLRYIMNTRVTLLIQRSQLYLC